MSDGPESISRQLKPNLLKVYRWAGILTIVSIDSHKEHNEKDLTKLKKLQFSLLALNFLEQIVNGSFHNYPI
jgi:hypothetical protein